MSKETNPIKEVVKFAANVTKRATGVQAFLQSRKDTNFPEGRLEQMRHRVVSGIFQVACPVVSESYSQEINGKSVILLPKEILDMLITAGAIAFAANGEWSPALGKSAWNVIAGSIIANAKRKEIKKPTTPLQLT